MGNIFTHGRFIAYVTDLEPKEYKGLESYKMFYRCFGFINKMGEMVGNIWYPIKTYMAFKDEHFKCVRDVDNKEAKYGFTKLANEYGFFVYPYLDYSVLNTDNDTYYFCDEYMRYHPVIQFDNEEVVHYSEKIKFEGTCLADMIWKRCDICGTYKGNIKTYGEKNYCPECLENAVKKCDYCGQYKNLDPKFKELFFTEDNTWICNDCIPKNYNRDNVKKCNCGTLIRMKNKDSCKYCRSMNIDAFKNTDYSYYKNGNLYTYWRHHYIIDEKLPPHLRYDEDIFDETEKYIWHD
jgi:hypothetical protein